MKKIIALLVFALFACVPAWSQMEAAIDPTTGAAAGTSAGPLLNGIRTPLIVGGALGFGSGTGVGSDRGIGLRQIEPMIGIWYPGLALFRVGDIRVDVAFVPVSRPDENGYCGLGISNYAWRTIFENARTVVFEINEKYPRLQGVDGSHRVHLSEADYIVEGEHEPLPQRKYKEAGETDRKIAELVAAEIPDGAVLSLGVGGVPFTVASLLAQSDLKDLGCHTGTISDAFLMLHKAGKLTNARKEFDTGRNTWNLCMGSQELYDWLDAEPDLFHPDDLDYVHDPYRIAKMSNVISINGGVQLDLMGQENGETAGTRQLSGIGGQMDFLEGAYRSPGGKGFICMNSSRVTKEGERKSNIVPFIPAGSTVSAPRTMIQYVATEYGVVKLSGLTVRERAEAMISVAHPDFRAELARYAEEHF